MCLVRLRVGARACGGRCDGTGHVGVLSACLSSEHISHSLESRARVKVSKPNLLHPRWAHPPRTPHSPLTTAPPGGLLRIPFPQKGMGRKEGAPICPSWGCCSDRVEAQSNQKLLESPNTSSPALQKRSHLEYTEGRLTGKCQLPGKLPHELGPDHTS